MKCVVRRKIACCDFCGVRYCSMHGEMEAHACCGFSVCYSCEKEKGHREAVRHCGHKICGIMNVEWCNECCMDQKRKHLEERQKKEQEEQEKEKQRMLEDLSSVEAFLDTVKSETLKRSLVKFINDAKKTTNNTKKVTAIKRKSPAKPVRSERAKSYVP